MMKIKLEGGLFKVSATAQYEVPGSIKFFCGIFSSWDNYIFLARHTIETEILDIDTTQIEVAALKEKIKKVQSEAEAKVTILTTAINNLLCIENSVEVDHAE